MRRSNAVRLAKLQHVLEGVDLEPDLEASYDEGPRDEFARSSHIHLGRQHEHQCCVCAGKAPIGNIGGSVQDIFQPTEVSNDSGVH